MGKLFDLFRGASWNNEAEVIHGFLYPLLTEVLGYRAAEILPEHTIPALKVPLNRMRSISTTSLHARPDFCLSLDGASTFVGACDAKAPNEPITNHLDQLRAYANALTTTNVLLITNGSQLVVYHANTELFRADSIADLDLHLPKLMHLLGRDSVAQASEYTRLTTLAAVAPSLTSSVDDARRRNTIDISDFQPYLRDVVVGANALMLRQGTLQTVLRCAQATVPAHVLHSFREFENSSASPISYRTLIGSDDVRPLVLIGDSGIGKSELLLQICRDFAERCLDAETNSVPLVVKLAHYTAGDSLEYLILRTTAKAGVPSDLERLHKLLSQGRLTLIFDAFDEVFESDIPVIERQLRALLESFDRTQIVVTTRPFRIPRIGSTRRYSIMALDMERIDRFVDLQVPEHAVEFHWQLRRYRLERVASNTLILAMLVNLLARGQQIPRTRMRILHAVVEEVRAVEEEKPTRFHVCVPWPKVVLALSRIALESFLVGDAYILPADTARHTLSACLTGFDAAGDIESGLSVKQLEDVLVSTGFVARESGGLVFWHRAFLEYFAARAVSEQLDLGTLKLASVISRAKWGAILPAAIAMSKLAKTLALEAASSNPLVALEVLVEMDELEAAPTSQILTQAAPLLSSKYADLRHDVMDAVSRLRGSAVDCFIVSLSESAPLGVRMWALVEVARRRLPGVRDLVYARLGWDEFDHDSFRGGHDAVIDALGEMGDREAQKTLASLWKIRPEGWISDPISRQLANLARSGLDRDVVDELLAWFESDAIEYHKLRDLARVLKAMGCGVTAASIVRRLAKPLAGPDFSNLQVYVELAESIDDVDVALSYVTYIDNGELPILVRRSFADALANSRANVSLDVYVRLTEHPDDQIRAEAFLALGRFRFHETEQVIGRKLRELRAMGMDGPGRPDLVQHSIVRTLAAQGRLSILLREEYCPRVLYHFSHGVIVEAMGRQNIVELVPFVMEFMPDDKRTRLLASIALALGEVGELKLARILRDRILAGEREPYTESELISGCHRLPAAEALEWLQLAWKASELPRESMSGFMKYKYVEALGRIGSVEARTIVVQRIAQASGADDVIDDLRILRDLATADLEDWLLSLLEGSRLPGRNARCWVMSILGRVGTNRSIAALSEFLQFPDPDLPQSAFRAIRDIRARDGECWLGDEPRT